jgi:surface antigen
MEFDHDKFINLYKSEYGTLDNSQASGLSGLLGFLEQDNHLNDVRWAAYMLATVKHECANLWQPIEEFGKGQGMPYGIPVTVSGSDGKTHTNTYYGRGYVQLTWVDNYRKMSYNLNLGDDVLIHPERALEAPVAYRIMSFGMRNGSFTGVGLNDYISGSKCEYYGARQIINGYDQATLIQGYAQKLEGVLRESANGKEGSKGTSSYQYHIVNAPVGVQARKGPGTSFPMVHTIPNNSPIDIVCQVYGETINGSNIWNKLADGTYVTDFYCDTPNFNNFSPPIPTCKDAPAPSPGQTAIKGDDYPFRNAAKDTPDGWGFDRRECTSFVAWRIRQHGVDFTNGMKGGWFGNALTWADNARKLGYRVDQSPSVGAIAHYDANAFLAGPAGHVAYVAQVNGDGSIVIEEYNWGIRATDPYAYHNPPRITHASQVSNFIHIV